jgi:hypothetical protein
MPRKHGAQTTTSCTSADLLDSGRRRGDNGGVRDEFTGALRSFRRYLVGEHKAPKTIKLYLEAGETRPRSHAGEPIHRVLRGSSRMVSPAVGGAVAWSRDRTV